MNYCKHLFSLLLILSSLYSLHGQTNKKTLNYQAVILDPKVIEIPGAIITGQPLNKGNVCLRFSLLNAQGGLDYEETQQVTTDEYGLVNVAIGNGTQASSNNTSIYKSFESIVWNLGVKSLKVSVSFDGCSSFKQVSTQGLNYTPYSLYSEAVDYKNVIEAPKKLSQFLNDESFLIPKSLDPLKQDIQTNSTQIETANQTIKNNKQTSDAAFLIVKQDIQTNSTQIETANQTIKNNKQTSDAAFLVVNQSLTSVDKQVTENTRSLTTMETKITDQQNQIVDNRNQISSTNNSMNAQIGGLQGQINTSNSTVSNLMNGVEMQSNKSTAANLGGANPSDQAYPSQRAAKAYVDQLVSQIATSGVPDATTLAAGKLQLAGDLGGTATNPTVPELANKENSNNKSTNVQTDAASDTKYPSVKAVKAYVDQATLGTALAADLANKANIASPSFTGTPTAPTPTSNDNSTKIATTAFVQAATAGIALQASIDGKADKNSPTFTGTPVLPTGTTGVTQTAGDNSTKLATTAYVASAVSAVSGNSGVPYSGATAAVNLGNYDLTVNGITAGMGSGNLGFNTVFGRGALSTTSQSGNYNLATGYVALQSNTTGSFNTANGTYSLLKNTTGINNTGYGVSSLFKNTSGNNNTAIGYEADVATAALANATAIGAGAIVAADNTIQLGNTAVTNVKTSGTITAGAVTYPKVDGTAGQVLTTNGTGTPTWTTPSGGGVDLTTNQTIGGEKTFSSNISANGVSVGRGNGNNSESVAIGPGAMGASNVNGKRNTAIGYASLNKYSGTSFDGNTSVGYYNLVNLTSGQGNTSVGTEAMMGVVNGSDNTSLGVLSLVGANGNDNVGVGVRAGQSITTGSQNTLIGYSADVSSNNLSNSTALGNGALVAASNNIQLGNTSVTNVKTSGTITAGSVTYPSAHGTSGQVLSTTGSGTLAWASASSSSGVPYSGATGAVNLGGYNLTVNELTIGSGKVGTSGSNSNTIVGGSYSNRTFTTVLSNTAIGYGTMSEAIPGNNNTAVGAYSLVSTTGRENSVIGAAALERNLGGNGNTAIGYYSLRNNTTGSNNTALGHNSLISNSPGEKNTMIGASADLGADNLTNATAIGYQAKVAASNTIQLGADGTNGTTAITNVKTSGTLTAGTVTYPKVHGTSGQVLSTTGSGTLAWASASSTSGVPYTGASQAVNLGGYDLKVNGLTIGTGYVNPTNTYNTIVGRSALNRTSPGTDNTAIGYKAIGEDGFANAGDKNTAVGSWTLIYNSGIENSALGVGALQQNQGGSQNTAMGNMALNINSSGSNNTALGYAADVSANNLSNATAIGNGAKVSASNMVRIGNASVTVIQGEVGWTAASDVRIKKNITNTNYGLSTVMKLRPVEYNLISNDLKQVGFIAQEVKKLVPEVVTGKEGDLKKGEILGITYANLVPVLTKAIQEQQKQIEDQNKQIDQQNKKIDDLNKKMDQVLELLKTKK